MPGLASIVFILTLFTTPVYYAQAGFFSFLTDFLGGVNKQNEITVLPSDTTVIGPDSINLLHAPANTNVSAGRGGAAMNFVQDSAIIPVVGPLGSDADIADNQSGTISIYHVQSGDTISTIAKMFGISVNTILWSNNLKRGAPIQPGATLVILPVSGVRHVVKNGDTLENIAKKYNANLDDILSYNDLSVGSTLKVGDEIIVPDGEIAASVVVPSGKTIGTAQSRALASAGIGYYKNPAPSSVLTQGIHGYNAVDLGASCGSPIYASASGNVIIAKNDGGWNGGYGNYVVIAHPNGTQTLYAHASEVYARVGSYVSQGELIGLVGTTGHSTGCHVHFEVRGAKNPFG